jgi:NAD(P)-dependent dehydrogenase (short-subunit alcohol dehydrogenase family)
MSEVNFDFSGKNFVVVGGSSGMGRATVLALAKAGAHVLSIGRNLKNLKVLQDVCPSNISIAQIDVIAAGDNEWEDIFRKFIEKYGKVHGTVYCAGITGVTPLRMFDEEMAKKIMDTSFWGMVRFLHCITKKKFIEKKSSHVVFSSVAAYSGTKGLFAYAGAKAAVQTAVKSIAKEIGHSQHCINSISPAWVDTEMTRKYIESIGSLEAHISNGCLGVGNSSDVVGMVLFLLSDRAKWITGADFVVDGGYLGGL